ncbi:MAG: hypoxanthine-guanine phosphoribosyltransferase [Marinomonas sp.]|jgi:hypoxanthine phosphoribosyltransferase|uniref:hypoxanthine-guanine phosphoribosyltransferase n=1 Tax=Marinomonas communis TaxID=28254 RepID=UPI000C51AD4D|nr:hypoxanthine-guanine phosphoribosyltransferase [Marinomonas communis]MAF15562.1 hypoxanthine-guanine phosphoribosyltransferase [Marinomonas sp.]MEC8081595.1 hypoxanthine-guanine phosphoribosyltransferase [Pseudomonadota bacterium]MCC4273107.1 hypoxanthine-guanine phosphoribosyltransferase [Marinomonas communis]MEC8484113.1 hypoxanthine-guanine phosphoribosyltransferase [Pseudomonadota bacterium]RUM53406.1 MAG: hypoxanthine-guanine phosphoribosyltransferase [Marinomonas sp.]|tara:strand:- start:318 stop:866 length:549 start_codon:yes stop_codon:yes gene_type:complete
MHNIDELNSIMNEADCLISEAELNDALDKMAKQITDDLADKLPLVICVMNGGLLPTGALMQRLQFPLELDYVHASRYGMETTGSTLNWTRYPQADFKGRDVLIVDDIFDQGHTLEAIIKWFEENGAQNVYSATVVNKLHNRKVDMRPDYNGLDVEDRFLFGYGMDYQGYFRNLQGIYAVKGK